MLALWAEMNVIVADEFRDGNVPALQEPLRVDRRALNALPAEVQERYFGGDSACYNEELLTWLRNEDRAEGPKGCIGFGVSAPMVKPLKGEILGLAEDQWKSHSAEGEVIKECAMCRTIRKNSPRTGIGSRCAMWPFERAKGKGSYSRMARR